MSSLNLPGGEFSSDKLKNVYNRYCRWSSSSSNRSVVHEGGEFSSDKLKNMYNRYCRWSSSSSNRSVVHEALCDAAEDGMDISKDLEDWFGKLYKGERSEELFEEFKTLVTTSPSQFRLLDDFLRFGIRLRLYQNEMTKRRIFLCSSDKVVFEMNKSAAISESVVLRNITDCRDDQEHEIPVQVASLPLYNTDCRDDQEHEIPVQVPSLVLSSIISFCKKNHKFNRMIGTTLKQLKIVLNRLEGTVNDYMGWINGFVKSNKPLFSHLHQAADYLHIPALLELTSMAIGDMKESSVEEISEWYAGLSIPRMLSPLGIQAFSTLSQFDFFS